MSYDIPDEIKYKEKIVFGLDFKQLGYLCAFGLLAFFSYLLPVQGDAKLVVPVFFLMVGAGFVFLNLEERAFDAYHFLTGVRVAGAADPRAQQFVGIRAVGNNSLYLRDGGMRAVLKVEPVNYSLLEESQRKALVLNYREFLNHLTSPVQILIRTTKPDLDEYFSAAQNRLKKAPGQLASLLEDFMVYENEFLEKNNVRERSFYLIVAHEPARRLVGNKPLDLGTEGELLEQKAKIVQEKLLACGLKSRRLENDDLAAFLATYSSQEAKGRKGDAYAQAS